MNRKILLALLLSMLFSIDVRAYDFMVGGIYYNIDGGEATVTYTINEWNYNHYKGDIIIPETVTYNNVTYPVTTIGSHAFYCCPNLKSVVIPNSIREIGAYAFSECYSLTSIEFGESVTAIGYCAFNECTSLVHVILPKSICTIEKYAFHACTGMNIIVIPNSITSIDENAFYECNNNLSVYIIGEGEWLGGTLPKNISNLFIDSDISAVNGMKAKLNNIYSFGTTPPTCNRESFIDYGGILHVPASSIAAYFMAPYWEYFDDIRGDAVAPDFINLSQTALEITVGEQASITASIQPNGAYPNDITWKSTNPRVATISDGTITACAAGECDIIATCLFLKSICHVKVKERIIVITLDQHEAQILPNHIISINVSASSDELPELTVTSSDPTVVGAGVSNGTIRIVGVAEGTATITVESADGPSQADSCVVIVYTEPGDVNCDGFVNISDVTLLIDYLLGSEPSPFKYENADLNNDNIVSIADVTNLIDLLLSDS